MRRQGLTLVMNIMLLGSGVAHAGAFDFEAQASGSLEHDNNVNLSVNERIASTQRTLALTGHLGYHADKLMIDVAPRMQYVRYSNAPAFDRNNAFLNATAELHGERSVYSVVLDGVQDSTTTSEAGVTGVTATNKRRRSGTATASGTWNISERTALTLQGAKQASRYQDAASVNLVDYDYTSTSLNAQHAVTEKLTLTAGANYAKLAVHGSTLLDKRTSGATLGIQYSLTDRSRFSLFAGPSTIRSGTGSQSAAVYSAQYQWQQERASFSVSAARAVTPNGFGVLSRQDSLDLNWYQPVSERWFSSVSVSALRNKYVQQLQQPVCNSLGLLLFGQCFIEGYAVIETPIDIKYGVLTGTLGWHATPTVELRVSAGVATQRVNQQTGRADRQHYALTLSWNGLARVLH